MVHLPITRVAPHLSRFQQIPQLSASALSAEPVGLSSSGKCFLEYCNLISIECLDVDPDQKLAETSGDNEESDTTVNEEDDLATDSEVSSSTDRDPIIDNVSIVESKIERHPLRARL